MCHGPAAPGHELKLVFARFAVNVLSQARVRRGDGSRAGPGERAAGCVAARHGFGAQAILPVVNPWRPPVGSRCQIARGVVVKARLGAAFREFPLMRRPPPTRGSKVPRRPRRRCHRQAFRFAINATSSVPGSRWDALSRGISYRIRAILYVVATGARSLPRRSASLL